MELTASDIQKTIHLDSNDLILEPENTIKVDPETENQQETCKNCFKIFSSKLVFAIHSNRCLTEPRTKSKLKLRTIRRVQSNKLDKKYICDTCGKEFATASTRRTHKFRNHRDTDKSDGTIGCKQCTKKFYSKESLEDHLKEHLETRRRLCLICRVKISGFTSLNRHIVRIHKGNYPGIKGPKLFRCTLCKLAFSSEKWLGYHMETHSGYRKRVMCKICKKSVINITQHMKTHSEKRQRYECQLCLVKFYEKDKLDRHLVMKHNEEHGMTAIDKDYKCDFCQMCFSTKKFIEYHMERHKEPRDKENLCCKICNKMYSSLSYLRRHKKTHYEAKVTCETCGKLVDLIFIAEHIKRNHNSKLQVFECTVCYKVFKYNSNLSDHMSTHSEKRRTCSICSKVLPTYSSLYSHKINLHGIGGHKCEKCGKSFVGGKRLLEHSSKCKFK